MRWLRWGLAALLAGFLVLDQAVPPDLSRARQTAIQVVDAEGRLLRAFAVGDGLWRLAATPAEVDPLYLAMLRQVEDRRFGWHPGIDPLAVVRAAGQWARAGRVVSGASTLTMQAARLLEPKPRTLRAKAVEAFRALQLQIRLGGDGVLATYLTLAPFGGNLEGIRAASLVWFGKEPRHLTPSEAALLVALPQSPERLRPDRHPEAARIARDRVLDRAVAGGVLGADQAAAAKADPVPVAQRAMRLSAPHLAERLSVGQPPGTMVRTWIDGRLQQVIEDLARRESTWMHDDGDMAVMVVSNRDRRVLAYAGSGNWRERPLDLAQARRSPGSALKPFIYALAFDDLSLHPGTLIEDAPYRFGDWSPRNFDHEFTGDVTAREALQRSLNVPAVLALERVGPTRLVMLLRQSGARLSFATDTAPGLPLALGGVGISLADMTMLYAGLGDGGRMLPLSYGPGADTVRSFQLVGDAAAWAVIDVLEGVPPPDGMANGRAVAQGRAVAYKTGTSFGYRDAWAVGVSADYTIGVWTGRADGSPRPGQLGRLAAAPILFKAFNLLPPDRAARPRPARGDHALLHRDPPPALVRLAGGEAGQGPMRGRAHPLRILFPPDGSVIEALPEGIALKAEGGRAPLRWVANGLPLEFGAGYWRPDGQGFARLVVVDSDGRRAVSRIRVALSQAR